METVPLFALCCTTALCVNTLLSNICFHLLHCIGQTWMRGKRAVHVLVLCLQPILPSNSECSLCHQTTNTPPPEVDDEDEDYSMRSVHTGCIFAPTLFLAARKNKTNVIISSRRLVGQQWCRCRSDWPTHVLTAFTPVVSRVKTPKCVFLGRAGLKTIATYRCCECLLLSLSSWTERLPSTIRLKHGPGPEKLPYQAGQLKPLHSLQGSRPPPPTALAADDPHPLHPTHCLEVVAIHCSDVIQCGDVTRWLTVYPRGCFEF